MTYISCFLLFVWFFFQGHNMGLDTSWENIFRLWNNVQNSQGMVRKYKINYHFVRSVDKPEHSTSLQKVINFFFPLKSISEVLVSVDTEPYSRRNVFRSDGKNWNKLILTRKLFYFSITQYVVYSFTLVAHLTSITLLFLTKELKK